MMDNVFLELQLIHWEHSLKVVSSTFNAPFSEGSNGKNLAWVIVLRKELLLYNILSSPLLSYSELLDPSFPSQMTLLSAVKERSGAVVFIV